MKYLIAVIVLAAVSSGEIFNRPCRTPQELEVKENFDPPRYLGVWWEIERYEQIFQASADCVRAQYTLNPDSSIRVLNQAFVIPNNTFLESVGRAVISFPDQQPLRAMLNVTFDPQQPNLSNYWVLSTDYFNYAFVVSCFDLPDNRSSESFWLISRTLELPSAARQRADTLIDRFLDRSRIRTTIQDNVQCQRPDV